MARSYFRVRLALLAIFAVLALGFLVSPGRAQPGRPPGFPGPPTRPPGFPTPPTPPRPQGFPGPNFGGVPSPPGFGAPSRSEWVCSNCRFVVGTGPVRPNVTQCPKCSVRFSNPGPGAPGGAGAAPGGAGAAPGGAPALPGGDPAAFTLVAPELPPNPAAGLPGTSDEPAASGEPSAAPTTSAPSGIDTALSREPEAKGGPRTLLIVGIVIAGVFVFGTLAMLAVVVAKANAPQRVRRPRPRLDLD